MKWILECVRSCVLLAFLVCNVDCDDPTMDTTEVHMEISVGKTVILPCLVRGLNDDGKYIVIWNSPSRRPISYNKKILVGRRFDIVQPYITEWNLKISPSQPGDSGEYLCQLNTDPVQQKSVHLSVQVPPRISSSEDIPNIIEGRQLIIQCNVSGRPRPTITWFKDGLLLPNLTEEELVINRVSRTDTGVYKCVASNGKDEDTATISVNVWYPPEVSVRSDRIGQLQRKKAVLECHSTANPQGRLVWKKGERVISKSTWQYEVQVFDEKTPHKRTLNLEIRSLDSTDYGEYVCEAENSVGKDTVSMYLYEITTVNPFKDTTTRPTIVRPVTDRLIPYRTTPVYHHKTTKTMTNEKYTNYPKGTTAVIVVVSDKSSNNNSATRCQSVHYKLVIALLSLSLSLLNPFPKS